MPDDDQLAATLAQIRADHEAANAFGTNASDPVPRLLGAVDAALKHHQPEPAVRLVPCEEHARWRGPLVGDNDNLAVRRACLRCQVFDEPYCRRCVDDDGRFQDWPCPEYRAVAAELAGKEAGRG